MQGEATKHPVVDYLKPIKSNSEETEGFPRGETGAVSVMQPPYSLEQLMGEMEEVTRETVKVVPPPTSMDSMTPNKGIPTTALTNRTKKIDISS